MQIWVPSFFDPKEVENNEMGEACSSDGKERFVYRVLVVKPE
jgi:hypothetical protein